MAKIMNELLYRDMKEGNNEYLGIHEIIKAAFGLDDKEYFNLIAENDMTVFDDIDNEVILHSWFGVRHIYSGRCDKGGCCLEGPKIEQRAYNKFIIIPPCGYDDKLFNEKVLYSNTKEGKEEAFFNTTCRDNVKKVIIGTREYYVCIDE